MCSGSTLNHHWWMYVMWHTLRKLNRIRHDKMNLEVHSKHSCNCCMLIKTSGQNGLDQFEDIVQLGQSRSGPVHDQGQADPTSSQPIQPCSSYHHQLSHTEPHHHLPSMATWVIRQEFVRQHAAARNAPVSATRSRVPTAASQVNSSDFSRPSG